MSREISFQHPSGTTGLNLYFMLFDKSGNAYNVVSHAFQAATSERPLFGLPLVEDTGSSVYVGDFPGSHVSTRGEYAVRVFQRAGLGPDIADEMIGSGSILWNGTAVDSPAEESLLESVYAKLNAGGVVFTVSAPVVDSSGAFTLLKNFDYLNSLGTALTLTLVNAFDLTGCSLAIARPDGGDVYTALVATPVSVGGSTQTVRVEAARADLAAFDPGLYDWELRVTTGGGLNPPPPVLGRFTIQ